MDGYTQYPQQQAWTPMGLSTAYNFSEELYVTSNTAAVSTAWPTANLAMYFPFYVQAPGNLQQIWWVNGSVVAGNVQVGIYDEGGNLIESSGNVAASGTSAPQAVSVVALLTCGRYYLAVSASSATQTFLAWTTGAAATNINRMLGVAEQVTANPLPASITFGSSARSYVPLVGISYLTLTI